MKTTDWSYQDFLTYLYHFAAEEDFEVEKEENDWIIDKVGIEEYQKVKKLFDENQETDHLQIIQHFGAIYCISEEAKSKILSDLKSLFSSDGRFSDVEQVLLLGIGKLLN